jgi:hypothetical protein
MPRAASAAATARSDVAPLFCTCRMIGATFAAKRSALAALAALPSLVARASFGPPSFRPRALAAASRLGALGYHRALVLGDGSKDVQREPRGVRVIDGDELDARVHERGDESQVTRKPVELRDDELGLELLAGGERGGELRPVVGSLAALGFHELGFEPPASAVEVSGDGRALRFESNASMLPLGMRGEAIGLGIVTQERAVRPWQSTSLI